MADRTIDDRIPPVSLDNDIGEQIYNALGHDKYKAKIQEMIVTHTGTVEFEELVMKYAGKEYDNRLLKSGKFWSATVATTIVTTIISVGLTLIISHYAGK